MSSPTPPNKPREISNEVRMVLAFILMGLILVGTQLLYRKLGIVAPEQQKTATPAAAKKAAAPASKGTASAPPSAVPAAPAAFATETQESEFTLDNGVYRIVFSNLGASVRSWTLKNFKDSNSKPLELVNRKGGAKTGYPFALVFRGQGPTADLNNALWVPHPGADGLTIAYEYSDGKTVAKKTFAFQRDGYMVQFADEVSVNGNGLPHLIQWRGGFGDMTATNPSGHQETIRYDVEKNKLLTEGAKVAKGGPVRSDSVYSFVGIDDQYFAAVFLPPTNAPVQTTTFADSVVTAVDSTEQPFAGLAVGGEARNQMGLYVGPKEMNSLAKVNPRLEGVIDWGWFGFIAKPLFLILQWLNNAYVHNYGWSIIVVTILINIATFPLKMANFKSMRKMQKLQPELNKINDKYKGISMSDPRAQQKQQETMELYKKHGVNPMGGCIPLLIQMPFLFAFYKVLSVTIEMRSAGWLMVTDLSQPEHWWVFAGADIRLLPIVMIISSYLMQRMTPMAGADPAQQRMMQFMPLMYGFFFWSASSGLVLYWLTSNLVGIAQQLFFNKTAGPVTVPAKTTSPAKDGRKRA
jgi:YidC/Oxa1 family membrane protein insertase